MGGDRRTKQEKNGLGTPCDSRRHLVSPRVVGMALEHLVDVAYASDADVAMQDPKLISRHPTRVTVEAVLGRSTASLVSRASDGDPPMDSFGVPVAPPRRGTSSMGRGATGPTHRRRRIRRMAVCGHPERSVSFSLEAGRHRRLFGTSDLPSGA